MRSAEAKGSLTNAADLHLSPCRKLQDLSVQLLSQSYNDVHLRFRRSRSFSCTKYKVDNHVGTSGAEACTANCMLILTPVLRDTSSIVMLSAQGEAGPNRVVEMHWLLQTSSKISVQLLTQSYKDSRLSVSGSMQF